MAMNYKDKITMKFNVSQLERIIIALINNGYNKKFASNVKRLFSMFNPNLYKTEYDKEVRVYLINEIVDIILENNIEDKAAILTYLNTDGRYYSDTTEILNNLYEENLSQEETAILDTTISEQLRYSAVMNKLDTINDKLINLKAENYDSLSEIMTDIESDFNSVTKQIKDSKESIENAKSDMSLSSSGFVSTLGELIKEERNPSMKVKTGIQYLNNMLDQGYARGRLYVAMGVAKG